MATIDPLRYQYEIRSENTNGEWYRIGWADQELLKNMEKRLRNAYIDYDLILATMHDGLVVRTPFAQYRAIPIDDKSTG